ncbi:YrbL family protein [Thalassomonas sp. M1454]|uniref:YrbL family protein n=1 Tax=Thalassomonas sp. M1454 TaxID=2594477 RepID=UPI00117FE9ED|nr:YrbL family protein [Thalassomonas sp. M1454]TRX58157.1 hypothetical protein FNN08_01840 [Thalassomonas sp. M1454]
MLQLKVDNYFAQGAERRCYQHPTNSAVCIKIPRSDAQADQNRIEKFYFSILKFRKVKTENILPKLYGPIITNLGKGLMFEMITDHDGKRSLTINDYISSKQITIENAETIIWQLCNSLSAKGILMDDKNPENILLKKSSNGDLVPILIDGFGAKTFSFKFIVGALLPFYARFKTKKRSKQLIDKMRNKFI